MKILRSLTFSKPSFGITSISIVTVLAIWGYVIFVYSSLPTSIPTKFDYSGNVVEKGPKYLILVLPIAATLINFKCYHLDKVAIGTIKIFNQTPVLRIIAQMGVFVGVVLLMRLIVLKSYE